MKPIADVAALLGLSPAEWLPYGRDKAKIEASVTHGPRRRPGRGRLVLVTGINPTPAGEGKTTTTIALGQALTKLGESVCLALREPSLGPCFGVKGGGTGGGRSILVPTADINLHFTGDFHAITSAHNLLAAVVDNGLQQGNPWGLDPRRVTWKRVLDMNDRALRRIVLGLGGAAQGVPREGGFDITAASEVMAILCLARDLADLRERLGAILVGYTFDKKPVFARDTGAVGGMLALLKDALLPNLVQSVEGTPALVHGGPFANIAHGCNSLIATRTALKLADWVVTEAGFGFDLGGEKFLHLVAPHLDEAPAVVLLVGTVRALKMHGGVPLADLKTPDAQRAAAGFANVEQHAAAIRAFGLEPLFALNRRPDDTDDETAAVLAAAAAAGVAAVGHDGFGKGGDGALELAHAVVRTARDPAPALKPLYAAGDAPADKIRAVARTVYGAAGVSFTAEAEADLKAAAGLGLNHLPVCMAKTPNSLTDDPAVRGRPTGFTVAVRKVVVSAGAGFLAALTGDIERMPGLPKRPRTHDIDVTPDGTITGVE